ncbi:uncharacterized protein BCR38DRAFT_217437 [Pseudomassariella vexata]|uniref:SET domain-containing protein n=1 Tax=Pseudomassariella vexata TaxID=1141098 RepID=A0A1Y2DUU1_9PEZI|nr:uncharacterized protein BCR38DRAFT_217437 [Pseudomassariella vexata]ORY62916.1 hypothetical protein BCR38DRAFT_217437 [Pseudomassariella vexata]
MKLFTLHTGVSIAFWVHVGLASSIDSSALCPSTSFQIQYCGRTLEHGEAAFLDGVGNELGPALKANNTARGVSSIWEVRESPGKGLGVFATTLITAGSRVMVEPPLFAIKPPEFIPGKGYEIEAMIADVDKAVAALSSEEQDEFRSCHEHRLPNEAASEHRRNMFIFRSNAYTLTDGKIAMFPKIAKINHSCRPNAANVWSSVSRLRIIWAARDILPGEEVSVTYAPLLQTREDRQKRLAQYGFRCSCEACHDHAHTDPRRKQMARLLSELEDRLARKTSAFANKKLLLKATALVEMLEEEHMMDYLPNAYRMAAELSFRLDNITAAEDWARQELRLHENADELSSASQDAVAFLLKTTSAR